MDQQLLPYDLYGSLAHAVGLHKIGLLSTAELKHLKQGIKKIFELDKQSRFQLKPGDEDIHTKIENYLTSSLGEVGKKIHTGRSRNDQVLTAIRLFTKDQLLQTWQELLTFCETLVEFTEKYQHVMIPGYTHMQKAMPSTVGMWSGAIAESLLDDLILLKAAYQLNNQSPLGSAAGYGVPLQLERPFVANLLGFDSVQNNPIYCQNSRGKIESAVVASLIAVLQEINKFASDLMLFTTAEFSYFEVAAEFCSGSSIMPQKKNVDVAELLRSKVHLLLGNYVQLVSVSSNLISGYNRDIQDTKRPLFESLVTTCESLKVAAMILPSIKVLEKNIHTAVTPDIFATHYALKLVQQGTPFREAYQIAAKEYKNLDVNHFSTDLSYLKTYIQLDSLQKKLSTEQSLFEKEKKKYQSSIKKLVSQKGTT